MERLRYLLNLLIATLLILTVAINKDGKFFGTSIEEKVVVVEEVASENAESKVQFKTEDESGNIILNSKAVVEGVYGYAGELPLKIYVADKKIVKVELEPNSETPSFLNRVIKTGLLEKWSGLSLKEAAELELDGVSGATLSSVAIIKNVQQSAAIAANSNLVASNGFKLKLKEIIALLVIVFGVVMNFMRPTNKALKILLFALNVAVLGIWCGSFISLSIFTAWAANGINLTMALVPVTLFFVAIITPLFGKKGAYCSHHCPMGAAQELVSLVNKNKVKIPHKIATMLNKLREAILLAMLFVMWLGVGFEVMDYEVFTAFLLSSASTAVLVMAVVFLLLSIFIHRPYCRFICPTGALLTFTQKTKINK